MLIAVLLVVASIAAVIWQIAARQGPRFVMMSPDASATVMSADVEPETVPSAPHCETAGGTRAVVFADSPGARFEVLNDGRVSATISSAHDDGQVTFATGVQAPAESASVAPGETVSVWVLPPAPEGDAATGARVQNIALAVSALGVDTEQALRLRPIVVAGDPAALCLPDE